MAHASFCPLTAQIPQIPSPRFCRNIHSLKNKNQKTKEKSTEKKGPDVKTRKVKVTLFVEGAIFGDTRSSIVGVSHQNTFLRDSPSTKCRMFQHKMRLQRSKSKLCKGRVAVDEFILESCSDCLQNINNLSCVSSCVKILSHTFHGRCKNFYFGEVSCSDHVQIMLYHAQIVRAL